MKSECCSKILFKYLYLAIFNEYGVPKSTFTKYLRNIYPLIQYSNLNYLKNRVEVGDISKGNFRETLGLTLKMN